jgi:hypothetical protein
VLDAVSELKERIFKRALIPATAAASLTKLVGSIARFRGDIFAAG